MSFLFAGMIAGVIIGTLALVPDLVTRSHSLVAAVPPANDAPAMTAPLRVVGAQPQVVMPIAVTAGPQAVLAPMFVPPIQSIQSLDPGAPAADQTLVTFLAAEKGERVVVDGRALALTRSEDRALASDDALRIACGKHRVKVGHKKARTIDFPCGAALTLE